MTLDEAMDRFVAEAQACVIAYHIENGYPGRPVRLADHRKLDPKKREAHLVRIVQLDADTGEMLARPFCWVDTRTGDIKRAVDNVRPAPQKRGSIYSETFEGYGVDAWGATRKD